MQKKNIIIVGGGFAGLHLTRKLNGSDYHVLLIDRQNHHQFQPLFYQVATARLEPANISFPFRKIFQGSRNVDIRLAEVQEVRPAVNQLVTNTGTFSYDILVLATGCKTNYFGNRQLEKFALAMKTTQEAIRIRNEVLLSFERFISSGTADRKAILNIVIVGGGPTGVELAGAFAEMKRNILPRDYPDVDFSELRVYLVEGSPNTLNSMSEQARKASKKFLEDLGVDLILQTFVSEYDGFEVKLSNGQRILSQNVIWAAGVTGNTTAGIDPAAINKNRYIVDRFNRIKAYSNIYALGDIAYMETPKFPAGHPQLANVAINQARNLGHNLRRMAKGRELTEYEYNDLGSMATVGKHRAVVDLPWIKFSGRLAWITWMFLHLMLILSARNKLIIFINWAWHYFTKDTSLRLIFKDPDELRKQPPGVNQ